MMQSKWFFPALIAAIGAGIYANCLHNGFTFDDWPLVVHNPMVIHPDVRAIFTSAYWPDRPDLGLFRPFTTLTYAINRWILGEAAFGYHLVNVILHTGNALLVLVCLRKFLKASGAMCCALIFLVHPLQTEAVNSIVGRAELLAVFCTLGAWFFLLYGKGYLRWILSATSLFFACLSKEQAAMMLFILALTAYLGRQEGGLGDTESRQRSSDRMNRFIRESLVGWALCLFAVLFFFWMRFNALGSLLLPGRPSFVDNPLAHVGILERWSTALTVIFDYASLIVWPWGLSADYSY
ncbi:MAG: DUF1736 domain-containing protein, partial [bacterium]|nr:DUF1736 domain-containing protein [bacterium]